MAKRKRGRAAGPGEPATATATAMATAMATPVAPREAQLPAETSGGVVTFFVWMMFLAPALGVPNEEMLQDTLKSIIVSFCALGAALVFFWDQRHRTQPLRWHAIVWLPLALMAYALGSMAWSHTYLAGVEAIRWFIFALIVWLGANSLAPERLPQLAWAIHAGAVVASLWAALQFWVGFNLFPQGPHPASTFVNRNFFAEFAVCTLPFAALLMARARQSAMVAFLAATTGLVVTAILMTGTRSALIALWTQAIVVIPFMAWRYRDRLPFGQWPRSTRVVAAGVLVGTVLGLGMIPSGDIKIIEEGRGMNALERGARRTQSISPNDSSLGVRMVMWKATMHVIHERPLAGVGAGAWESEIPLYQAEGSQLETDYYVHNEFLQLLAEYGLVGWAFLLALFAYLLWAAWVTWREKSPGTSAGPDPASCDEAPWRAVALCSLLAFMIVSNVGFPWRMAATGGLFALLLAILAASDARLGLGRPWAARSLAWKPAGSQAAGAFALAATALGLYITEQAAQAEQKIVHATKLALTITASNDPNNPKWDATKAELLESIRGGIEINRHYRKITPMVADELARWGDWRDAAWIWDSVLSSRPYVVAIIANVARAAINSGDMAKAEAYLDRAMRIHPDAPAVRSLQVLLYARTHREVQALELARKALADNIVDFDLVNSAFLLAARQGDYAYAEKAMRLRVQRWPQSGTQGLMQLADMYIKAAHDNERAVEIYREAVATAPVQLREQVIANIPTEMRSRVTAAK